MKKVAVLLSTYNGARYLETQLESIYAQEGVEVILYVRDDGSTDDTLSILTREQQAGRLTFTCHTGNIKPARSFLKLLQEAPTADAYAFADQDDYWKADKLRTAMDYLAQCPTAQPALYYCQTLLVDAQLKPLTQQVPLHPMGTFHEALMYHFVGGCTMVMNEAMRTQINGYTPSFLLMHDIWIYLVAQAIKANIYFDPIPHILYRQHEDNAVGQMRGKKHTITTRFKRVVMRRDHVRSRMARDLLIGYGSQLSANYHDAALCIAQAPSSVTARTKILTNRDFACGNQSTQQLFRLAVILGTL